MNSDFDFLKPFDLGAYLFHTGFSIVPGCFWQTVNTASIITKVVCHPFEGDVNERWELTFWTFKHLTSSDEYEELVSAIHEIKLPTAMTVIDKAPRRIRKHKAETEHVTFKW